MTELSNKEEKLLKIAESGGNDKDLLLFEELEDINATLKVISEKEPPPFPEFPTPLPYPQFPEQKEVVFPDVQFVEVLNFPEVKIPKMDMSKTNSLLQELIDKEPKQIDINVTLKIDD